MTACKQSSIENKNGSFSLKKFKLNIPGFSKTSKSKSKSKSKPKSNLKTKSKQIQQRSTDRETEETGSNHSSEREPQPESYSPTPTAKSSSSNVTSNLNSSAAYQVKEPPQFRRNQIYPDNTHLNAYPSSVASRSLSYVTAATAESITMSYELPYMPMALNGNMQAPQPPQDANCDMNETPVHGHQQYPSGGFADDELSVSNGGALVRHHSIVSYASNNTGITAFTNATNTTDNTYNTYTTYAGNTATTPSDQVLIIHNTSRQPDTNTLQVQGHHRVNSNQSSGSSNVSEKRKFGKVKNRTTLPKIAENRDLYERCADSSDVVDTEEEYFLGDDDRADDEKAESVAGYSVTKCSSSTMDFSLFAGSGTTDSSDDEQQQLALNNRKSAPRRKLTLKTRNYTRKNQRVRPRTGTLDTLTYAQEQINKSADFRSREYHLPKISQNPDSDDPQLVLNTINFVPAQRKQTKHRSKNKRKGKGKGKGKNKNKNKNKRQRSVSKASWDSDELVVKYSHQGCMFDLQFHVDAASTIAKSTCSVSTPINSQGVKLFDDRRAGDSVANTPTSDFSTTAFQFSPVAHRTLKMDLQKFPNESFPFPNANENQAPDDQVFCAGHGRYLTKQLLDGLDDDDDDDDDDDASSPLVLTASQTSPTWNPKMGIRSITSTRKNHIQMYAYHLHSQPPTRARNFSDSCVSRQSCRV